LRALVPILALFVLIQALFAGTTGKVAGRITDSRSGEPVPFVNVYLDATSLGAATSDDGFYFILNVPPGTYTLKVEHLGYRTVEVQEVRVNVDKTSFFDIVLEEATLTVEEVVVRAETPIIEPDATWKVASVTREELADLPVTEVSEVLSLQGGVIEGPSGELHVRGGRSDELTYLIDGIPVKNPLTGEFEGFIEKSSVEELTMLAGTYSAEYGDALSGVVNVVTKEGGRTTSFGLEVLSGNIYLGDFGFSFESPYRRSDWIGPGSDAHRDTVTGTSLYAPQDITDEFGLPFLGEIRAHIGGPIPGIRARYFLSGTYWNRQGHLPFGYRLLRSLQGRLDVDALRNLKLSLSLQGDQSRSQGYSHKWKYLYENYPKLRSTFLRANLTAKHLLSSSTFYTIIVGLLEECDSLTVEGRSPEDYQEPITDEFAEFYLSGDAQTYRISTTRTLSLKADLVHQAGHHEIKLGLEGRLHRLDLFEMQRIFFIGYLGESQFQDFVREPREGALYVQDKLEYEDIVVNLGVRLDYADPRWKMWEDIEDPNSPLKPVDARVQISPRIGMAYPVTERISLHFAYGHFFQRPPYETLYMNPNYLDPAQLPPQLGIVGNAAIRPQKTAAYEVGVALAIGREYGCDVTVYAKDIWDLLSTRTIRSFPYEYTVFTNMDFASVRGLDLTLKRRFAGRFGGSLTYTYQIARGNRSFPLKAFYDAYSGLPEAQKEYNLDFDRRHDLSLRLDVELPLAVRLGITAELMSGLPYTPYAPPGVVVEENSARMPWTGQLDLLLNKTVPLLGSDVNLILQVKNVLDLKNAHYVYSRTGDPWDPGDFTGVGIETEDYASNPAHVGSPREFKLGARISF
jgi:outer membrane receptor protein involved in Fe transport